jgi:membrane-bound metal-dependent hydrolase YbcI (DUF457 family)
MPNYKGHLVGGVAAYALVLLLVIGTAPSLITAFEWLLCALAGCLFPDIDTKSKGQKYFYRGVLMSFIVLVSQGKYEVLSCCSFIMITPMLVRHRGVFHNPAFIMFIAAVVWILVSVSFPQLSRPLLLNLLFFVVGAFSHIFLDRFVSRYFRS